MNGGLQRDPSTSQRMARIWSKPPEARKRQRRIPLWVSKEAWPCQHLDFELPVFVIVRKLIYVALSHILSGIPFWHSQETNIADYGDLTLLTQS